MRHALALGAVLACLALAGGSLWHQDWRYSLPTPRPAGLVQLAFGAAAPLASGRDELPRTDGRPLVLHFASSECPCSGFAVDHVRELVREFGDRARFVVVEEGEGGSGDALDLPEIRDADGAIAARFGVYSTPQAVVIDGDDELWYRGNYNASRYCTDPRLAYARLALEALLAGDPRPAFPPEATVAYGCALPSAAEAP